MAVSAKASEDEKFLVLVTNLVVRGVVRLSQ